MDHPNNFKSAINERGVQAVLTRLRATLAVVEPERRGEALAEFFSSTKYHRRSGERINEWMLRFEEGLDRLKEDGIDLVQNLEDIAGWMMVMRAGLSSERRERCLAAIPLVRPYLLAQIRPVLLRQFVDLHLQERTRTRAPPPPSFSQSRGRPHPRFHGRSRSTNMVDEDDDDYDGDEGEDDEYEDDAYDANADDGESGIRQELEALTVDLQGLEAEGYELSDVLGPEAQRRSSDRP